jgi:hypothetical protein
MGSKRFHELTGQTEILNISASTGSIIDRWGATLTNTATSVVKDGDVRAMLFDGATSVVETTLANDINSVLFWMKPVTDTESIIDLGGGNTITTSGGTLTAAWADNIYVNGAVGTTVTTGKWNLVICTVGTAISLTAIDIGKITATFFSGTMNDIRIVTGVLVAQECSQLYTNERQRYV